ncbi:hypothetical protein F5Y04DRAFT_234373 [Hypomontagnella monticulosa]|nr:hypothetical protein F5Y04DRAFT_234373 [Hypomontagnella monticulosa]
MGRNETGKVCICDGETDSHPSLRGRFTYVYMLILFQSLYLYIALEDFLFLFLPYLSLSAAYVYLLEELERMRLARHHSSFYRTSAYEVPT